MNAKNIRGETPLDAVAGQWTQELESIYQWFAQLWNLQLDLERIKATRPQVAALLRQSKGKAGGRPKEVAAGVRSTGYRGAYFVNGEIHVNTYGTPEGKPLTSGHQDFKPSWSKTGDMLVFFRRLKDDPVVTNWKTAICIINVDGTDFHQLTDGTHTDFNQTWTRDGTNTPIWNRKNPAAGGFYVMKSKVSAKPGLGNLASGQIVEEDGQKFVVTPGKPYYNTRDHMDMFVNGLIENQKVGEMALQSLDQCRDKRFLFFVHFAEPDHAGHQKGENSQEYSDALTSDDEWTGKIVSKLRELGIYDKTLVYVVVDHGFNEGQSGHSYAPYVFVATNDRLVTRKAGVREDIAPTVLERFGIDLAKIEPPLDGIPLDKPAADRFAPAEKPGATQSKPAAAKTRKAGNRKKKKADAAGDSPQ